MNRSRNFRPAFGLTLFLAAGLPCSGLRADINGFGNGTGFTLNSGATISSGTATMTVGGVSVPPNTTSVFYNTPQAINGFNVSFTYAENSLAATGGVAFVLQDDARGAQAISQSGTLLGSGGTGTIKPAAAVELNLLDVAGVTSSSTNYTTSNAAQGVVTLNTNNLSGSVNLFSRDAIRVDLSYNGSVLTEMLTDTTQGGTPASYTYNVGSLTSLLGSSTAYVGFTGDTGVLSANQTISGFSFTAVPEPSFWGSAAGGGLLLLGLARLRRGRNAHLG